MNSTKIKAPAPTMIVRKLSGDEVYQLWRKHNGSIASFVTKCFKAAMVKSDG